MQLSIANLIKRGCLFACVILSTGCGVLMSNGNGEPIALADRQQIDTLIADYSYHYDGGDITAFSELFAEHGSLFINTGEVKSRRDIYLWALARRKQLSELGVKSRHIQTNTRLNMSGLRMTGKTQLLLIWTDIKTGISSLRAEGIYYDEFVKTRAGWRFLSRRIGVEVR